MAGKVLNMNEIHKIIGSGKINRSVEKPATAHTLNRYPLFRKKEESSINKKTC